jgi:hypothetical protein
MSQSIKKGTPLTPDEVNILTDFAEGFSQKELETKYCLTDRGIYYHFYEAGLRLGTSNRQETCFKAWKEGLIKPHLEELFEANRPDENDLHILAVIAQGTTGKTIADTLGCPQNDVSAARKRARKSLHSGKSDIKAFLIAHKYGYLKDPLPTIEDLKVPPSWHDLLLL